jgi:drug/metabolite transporter (DMT)-like permease
VEVQLANKSETLDSTAMLTLVVLCTSWGLQQVSIKVANAGVSPVLQAGFRSIGAAVIVWLLMILRRERILDRDGTLWWGIAAGVLFAAEFLLIYWGLDYTNASRAVVFLYLCPFVVALGAHLFIPGERMRLIQVIGLICAFIGILLIFGESLTFPSQRMMIGDLMLIGAAILWGATTVMIKASPLVLVQPTKILIYQLAVSAVVLPLGSYAMGEPGIMKITPLILGCILYQVLWVASFTYLIWFWLIRNYPASRISSFTFLTPLLGVLAGGFLLNEPITVMLLIALIFVSTGIYLVNRPKA